MSDMSRPNFTYQTAIADSVNTTLRLLKNKNMLRRNVPLNQPESPLSKRQQILSKGELKRTPSITTFRTKQRVYAPNPRIFQSPAHKNQSPRPQGISSQENLHDQRLLGSRKSSNQDLFIQSQEQLPDLSRKLTQDPTTIKSMREFTQLVSPPVSSGKGLPDRQSPKQGVSKGNLSIGTYNFTPIGSLKKGKRVQMTPLQRISLEQIALQNKRTKQTISQITSFMTNLSSAAVTSEGNQNQSLESRYTQQD